MCFGATFLELFDQLTSVWDFIAAHTSPSRHTHTPFLALLATFILLYADDLVLIADSAAVIASACFRPLCGY